MKTMSARDSASVHTGERRAPHYRGIDGVRALAVLAVVFFHLNPAWLPGGFIGVDVFFAVSGFVVSSSVATLRAEGFGAFLSFFYARRLLRIAPALLVCLLVTSLLTCLFVPRAWLSNLNRDTAFAAFFGVSNWVLANNAGNYFSPRSEFNPFTHTWSLAIEEQFYLLFPFAIYAWLRFKASARRQAKVVLALAALTAASLAYSAWASGAAPVKAFYLIPSRFWELGCGVLLFLTGTHWLPYLRQLSSRTAGTLGAVCMLVLAGSFWWADEKAFPFPWALPPVLATLGLLALAVSREDTPAIRGLSLQPVVGIGRISYSLYLWHWPTFVLLRWTAGLQDGWHYAVALPVALLLALASYRWVEKPLRRSNLFRRLPRLQVVAISAMCICCTSVLSRLTFSVQPRILLSATKDRTTWQPDSDIETLPLGPCTSLQTRQEFMGGQIQHFTPGNCSVKAARRLFVGGDSHAWAYSAMLRLHAEHTGNEVQISTKVGCPLFRFLGAMSDAPPACVTFMKATVGRWSSELHEGDILFLPSLRIPRLRDQWGGGNSQPDADSEVTLRQRATDEAVALLKPIADRGVLIVFEAPKPVYRVPLFRCSDWFNKNNPVCEGGTDIPRAEVEAMRTTVLKDIQATVNQLPNARIWDPLPTLCTAVNCSPREGQVPLYFDGDHLSGRGNAKLSPVFDAFIESLPAPKIAH